jgi:ubiquinone/menaquinone biosynthesis C-methylase UbiE
MSDFGFRLMKLTFDVIDFFNPHYIDRRVAEFGILPGMTVVDYGCGLGRYTTRLARLVGEGGKVIAVDVQVLALETVNQRAARLGLKNVRTALAQGYDCGLPGGVADVVCAIDMFFSVSEPSVFLKELHRITRPDGMLVIDDGHQSRATTKEKLLSSGYWQIVEETKDHIKCKPL